MTTSVRFILIVALSLSVSIVSNTCDAQGRDPAAAQPRSVVPAGRRSIGIAFEGGGALGIAHIGVMLWLDEHRIPIDSISGTSMGALVGALFASGHSAAQVASLAKSDIFETLFTTQPSLSHASLRRREDREELPHAFTLGLKGRNLTEGNDLITDDQLNALLAKELTAYNTPAVDFDDLPIPFRCVASNLTTLTPYTFHNGSLPFAVRASISIPGVFSPVHTPSGILVDGAIIDNLPTDVLRHDMHPDVAIAVYLGDSAFSEKDAASLINIIERALSAGTSRNVALTRPLADIEISPAVQPFSVMSYSKGDALIKAGYDAAEAQRGKLMPYALSESDWKLYQDDLATRRRPVPQRIDVVRVGGPDHGISVRLAQQADKLADQPFHEEAAEALVSNIRGEGALDAYFETFHTPPPPAQDASVPKPVEPDNGLIIQWYPRSDGPPFLLLDGDLAAMNGNVTSSVLDLRFVDENLGGYGSELRTDAQFGYLTRLRAEYYEPIASSRFFVQPHLLYLRQPVYYWEDQKRVSERLLQRAGGGMDVGMTLARNFQVSAQYTNAMARWILKDGSDDSPTQHLSGTTQSIAGHVFLTNRSAAIASPTGGQFDLIAGRLLHTAGSPEAPFALLKARQSFTFDHSNSLIFSVNASTYFRNNVADPFRFTLGGPLRLSASSVDEFRGTDIGYIQSIYLRRVTNLPTGLGQGVYIAGGYEGASVWSPERHSILRQDGIVGILINSPIGVFTLGGAIGDAGHRKVFLTLGKFF